MINDRVAFLAMLSQLVRFVSGPLVLIAMASQLSSGEIAVYYTFFSIIAIQQILEMGLGFTLKQNIAAVYSTDNAGGVRGDSIKCIVKFVHLSRVWYFFLSMFILLVVGFFGQYFFNGVPSEIDWLEPWWMLIIVVTVVTNFIPMEFLVEGCQRQVTLHSARLTSSLINGGLLACFISLGCALYSIALAKIVSSIFMYHTLYSREKSLFQAIGEYTGDKELRTTFSKVWPMLSKLSVSWTLGYFFWNSFNPISIKTLDLDIAGKLAFSMAMAMIGYNVASSLINSQTTIITNHITSGKVHYALNVFRRYNYISIFVIVLGFSAFLVGMLTFPDFFVFDKVLPFYDMATLFFYITVVMLITNQANFSRCFLSEPYFHLSICSNVITPLIYFLSCFFLDKPDFSYLILFSIFILVWSGKIMNQTVSGFKAKLF